MVLKNIQSCPSPSGGRGSEAKLTEQRLSCAPQRARNVSHGFSFPLLWRVNHHCGCNARLREKKEGEIERETDRERRRGRKRYRSAADVFCAAGLPLPCRVSEGMQGRLSSGVGEANQHFSEVLMDSTKNLYLH